MGSSMGRAAPFGGVGQRFEFSPINYQVRIWLDEDAVLKTVERDERFGGSSPSRIAKEIKMKKYLDLADEYIQLNEDYHELANDYIKLANCYKELKKENAELKEKISEWKRVSECDTPVQLNNYLTGIDKKLQMLNQKLKEFLFT